jgi:hypothetical protein
MPLTNIDRIICTPTTEGSIQMLDDAEVFKRLAAPGDQDDDDWWESLDDKVLTHGRQ